MMNSENVGKQTWEEEIEKLRQQVCELQGQLEDYQDLRYDARTRNRERSGRSDADDLGRRTARITRDAPARMMDESSRLMRGITFTFLEQLNMWANVVNTFTDEVVQRNRPDEATSETDDFARRGSDETRYADGSARTARENREWERSGQPRSRERTTAAGLAARLPLDIYAGCVRALDESLNTPRRVVDRWSEIYRETDDIGSANAECEDDATEPLAAEASRSAGRKRRTAAQRASDAVADAVESGIRNNPSDPIP